MRRPFFVERRVYPTDRLATDQSRCEICGMPDCHASLPDTQPDQEFRGFRAWQIDASSALPVDMVWISSATPTTHFLLPFMEPSIVVRREAGYSAGGADILISSAFPDSGIYDPKPGEELIALRLRPETSAAQLGLCPKDYRDLDPVLAPTSLRAGMADISRIAEQGTATDIARALLDNVQRLAPVISLRPAAIAARMIRQRQGNIGCRLLSKHVGLSERQMRRSFMNAYGMPPKAYARRVRLTAAIVRAEKHSNDGWAQTALAAGYNDQPHLIRDCRALMKTTPAALLRRRAAMSAFSNNC